MIPPRLIQSVPEHTSPTQDRLWSEAQDLHPDWECVSYRDPINPELFPITSPYWAKCSSGAQLAGLVRLEALLHLGGIWIDSDIQLFRPLDPLRPCRAFAAWEEPNVVPDAVIGAEAGHPAIGTCVDLAIERLNNGGGAWETGPGVTTTVFPDRHDVLLLGPDTFYPVFYDPRHDLEARLDAYRPQPWTFGMHRWDWSWRP